MNPDDAREALYKACLLSYAEDLLAVGDRVFGPEAAMLSCLPSSSLLAEGTERFLSDSKTRGSEILKFR